MTETRTPPPIPPVVNLATGAIRVVYREGMFAKEKCWGEFDWIKREIALDTSLTGSSLWLTFEHEKVHAILFDAGVLIPDRHEEAVCNAIAAARVAEMVRLGEL